MDGIEISKNLKILPETRGVPFILIPEEHQLKRHFKNELSIDGTFERPFDKDSFLQLLSLFLEHDIVGVKKKTLDEKIEIDKGNLEIFLNKKINKINEEEIIYFKSLKSKIEYIIETKDTHFCSKVIEEFLKDFPEDRSSDLYQWFQELKKYSSSNDLDKLKMFLIKSLNDVDKILSS